MMRGDEWGLFWNEPPRQRANAKDTGPRPLPPIPDTGWVIPEGRDAYRDLSDADAIAVDVEAFDPDLTTSGPGHVKGTAHIVGVALGTPDGWRQYFPIAHENGPNLPKERVFKYLREQLGRRGQPKVGANLIYDLEALACAGVPVEGPFYDVQVAEPLLNENRLKYDLDTIAEYWLREGKKQDVLTDWLTKAFGGTNIKQHIWRAPATVAGPYAEGDVDLPLRIFELQRVELERQGLWELFLLESRLIPMLLAMRLRGVPVNVQHAEKLKATLQQSQKETIDEIKRLTGVSPNIWAADSLASIFDKLQIEYPRTRKTNAPSFRKEWLAAQTHPVANLIKQARHFEKFETTFLDGYILNGHINSRVHGQFHQLRSDEGGTVSGRFSSSNPNLQNIPTRTREGTLIRQAFIAEHGQLWWKFDWSQVEYRLIAHYAASVKGGLPGSDVVVARYNEDASVDYHQMVAEMTGLKRSDAKNLNFGLAYGQGVDLLCANLGVDRETGERIMAEYHDKAPFIKPLMQECMKRVDNRGIIRTLLGRARRFNVWERGGYGADKEFVDQENKGHFASLAGFMNANVLRRFGIDPDMPEHCVADNDNYLRAVRASGWKRAFQHKGLNALIQGSAADIMKKAMVQAWEDGAFDDIGAPHLTVHDELDGSFDPGIASHVQALKHVKHVMETCVTLKIPLIADGGTGENWGAIKEAA